MGICHSNQAKTPAATGGKQEGTNFAANKNQKAEEAFGAVAVPAVWPQEASSDENFSPLPSPSVETGDEETTADLLEIENTLLAIDGVKLQFRGSTCDTFKNAVTVAWCDRPVGQPRPVHVFDGLWKLDHLQDLRLCKFPYTKLPCGIGNLARLTRLTLNGAEKSHWFADVLREIPGDIGKLKSLREFSIIGCDQVESLPPEIGKLDSLEELILCGCSALLCLPPEICRPSSSLRRLELLCLRSFEQLPERLGMLSALESLIISDCRSLTKLPVSAGNLRSLSHLAVSAPGADFGYRYPRFGGRTGGWSIDIPPEIQRCQSLQTINFSNITRESLLEFFAVPGRGNENAPPRLHALKTLSMRECGLADVHLLQILPNLPCGLECVDLSRNEIKSFDAFVEIGLPPYIRCLGLDHNPVLRSGDFTTQRRRLVALLNTNRRLGRLVDFQGNAEEIFTCEILHLLFFNQHGRSLVEDSCNKNTLPPSLWPVILEQVSTGLLNRNIYVAGENRKVKGTELQAGVIFSLLRHGLVLLGGAAPAWPAVVGSSCSGLGIGQR